MKLKQAWLEIFFSVFIVLVFTGSFSFAVDTFTGRSFIPSLIVFLDNLTLSVITFYATFVFLILSGCVLLYPNKDSINSFLTRILRPILGVASLTIINGKISWNDARKNGSDMWREFKRRMDKRIKIRVESNQFKIDKFDVRCWKIRIYSDSDYIYWEFIKR